MMDRLVLEIEVVGFNADGIQEAADEYDETTVLDIVTTELMRENVGLTFVSIPGEKEMTDDFEVHAMNGHIVGARIIADT
jgi:hypothetical protein